MLNGIIEQPYDTYALTNSLIVQFKSFNTRCEDWYFVLCMTLTEELFALDLTFDTLWRFLTVIAQLLSEASNVSFWRYGRMLFIVVQLVFATSLHSLSKVHSLTRIGQPWCSYHVAQAWSLETSSGRRWFAFISTPSCITSFYVPSIG